MTNEQIMELMQRDLDGDLSPEEQQLLYSSIQANPDYQLMYGRLKKVSDQLEQLPPVTPAFSIVDSILPQLDAITREPVVTSATDQLPRLEVKKNAPVPESRKWKGLPVWTARVGSGLVAACLLFGLFIMTNGPAKNEADTVTQGAITPAPGSEQPDVAAPPVPKTENGNHQTPPSDKTDKPATPQNSGDKGSTRAEQPKQQVTPKPPTVREPAEKQKTTKQPAVQTAPKQPNKQVPAVQGNKQTDKWERKENESRQADGKDRREEEKKEKQDKERNGNKDREKDDRDDDARDDDRRKGKDKDDKDDDKDSGKKKALNTKNGAYSPLFPFWKSGFVNLKWTGTRE